MKRPAKILKVGLTPSNSGLLGGKHLKSFSPKMLKIVYITFPNEGIKDKEKNCRR
jgi:hypothetical protein